MSHKPVTKNKHAKEIIALLSSLQYRGHSKGTIFRDWLTSIKYTLMNMPMHMAAMQAGEPLPKDTGEIAEHFSRIKTVYGNDAQFMANALGELLIAASKEYSDVIGQVFMAWGLGNSATGQYYTPMEIASLKALMLNPMDDVYAHIKSACTHPENAMGTATLLAGLAVPDEKKKKYFVEKVIPAALQYYEPVNVYDPCCGSGVAFLAAAKVCEPWAITYGMVQFYGCDIDPRAVDMAQINIMLHGLNGTMSWVFDLNKSFLNRMPEPYRKTYTEAIDTLNPSSPTIIEDISNFRQLKMF